MFTYLREKLLGKVLHRFGVDDSGATAIEYALMGTAIAVAIIVIVFTLGGTVDGMYQDVNDAIVAAP